MNHDAGRRPFLIGLTGPIGCGKSTIGAMLAELGGYVINADVLARRVTEDGTPSADGALSAIRKRFGENVFDRPGHLDRAALAERVFADGDALAALEGIVHPLVRREVDTLLDEAAAQRAPFVVIEAIKLVEGGLADRCDEVWLIECSRTVQRSRLARRGTDADDIERRMAAQGGGLVTRLEHALAGRSVVRRLSTDGALADVRQSAERWLAQAKGLA